MTFEGSQARWRRLGMVVSMACLAWTYGAVLQAQSEQVEGIVMEEIHESRE